MVWAAPVLQQQVRRYSSPTDHPLLIAEIYCGGLAAGLHAALRLQAGLGQVRMLPYIVEVLRQVCIRAQWPRAHGLILTLMRLFPPLLQQAVETAWQQPATLAVSWLCNPDYSHLPAAGGSAIELEAAHGAAAAAAEAALYILISWRQVRDGRVKCIIVCKRCASTCTKV